MSKGLSNKNLFCKRRSKQNFNLHLNYILLLLVQTLANL